MVEWGELTLKVVRLETGGQEVLARAGNFMVSSRSTSEAAFEKGGRIKIPPNVCRFNHAKMWGERVPNSMSARVSAVSTRETDRVG
jgi:hypothetical protein